MASNSDATGGRCRRWGRMRVARTNEALPPAPPPSTDLTNEATPIESAPRDRIGPWQARSASPFEAALHGLGRELDRGEVLTEKAIRGGSGHASPEQLIA